jgi:hypothetical protein
MVDIKRRDSIPLLVVEVCILDSEPNLLMTPQKAALGLCLITENEEKP